MQFLSRRIWGAVFFILAFLSVPIRSMAGEVAASKLFAIFDATEYRGKPDLSGYGFKKIRLHNGDVTTPRLIPRIGQQGFSEEKTRATALLQAKNPDELVSLDLETWGFDSEGLKKYLNTLTVFKKYSPNSVVGYYGYMPYNNRMLYEAYASNKPENRRKWEQWQVKVAPIGRSVDVFMPSLYTWGKDIVAWQKTAKEAIAYARKIDPGKKVYAYIWPQYYDNHTSYELDFVPATVWREELETLYPIADGVIIWSGWKDRAGNPIAFSQDMPWFQQTLLFMKEHNLH